MATTMMLLYATGKSSPENAFGTVDLDEFKPPTGNLIAWAEYLQTKLVHAGLTNHTIRVTPPTSVFIINSDVLDYVDRGFLHDIIEKERLRATNEVAASSVNLIYKISVNDAIGLVCAFFNCELEIDGNEIVMRQFPTTNEVARYTKNDFDIANSGFILPPPIPRKYTDKTSAHDKIIMMPPEDHIKARDSIRKFIHKYGQ